MKIFSLVTSIFLAFVATPSWAAEFSTGYSGGNCSTCSWIAVDGEIEDGDASRLLTFIEATKNEHQDLIVINSPGGNVAAALELGALVRKRRMSVIVGKTTTMEPEGAGRTFETYSGGICASACAFVLMGGVTREVADEDSAVGVHQFTPALDELKSAVSITSNTQTVMAILQSFAQGMGVNPSVLTIAATAKPSEMHWLDVPTMEQLNLLTSRSRPSPAKWSLEPFGHELLAQTTQDQSNGRSIMLLAACQSLHVGIFVPDSDRLNEIMASVSGASLRTISGQSYRIPIIERSIHGEMIVFAFRGGAQVFRLISNGMDDLELDLDLPRPYWQAIGGSTFQIPTSNIAEIAPHVLRSCS